MEQEELNARTHKGESDKQSQDATAAAAADGKQFEGTVKDTSKHSEGHAISGWLPGWNLSGLTQLTGAVTNTVKHFYLSTTVTVIIIFFSVPLLNTDALFNSRTI